MRNLKKVLSLVLCVAVMLSVMVLGAGAAFSDQDKIENTEAVEMATALKIISGYEDGSYHPERNIKRSEMCKMICIALNGGKEPATSTKDAPTFSDIDGHWAEGYIEYCYAQGVVSGVGGGRFNPDGNVTVTQAAKMLLVALGYNADVEQFNGTNWSLYVNVKANQDGIYKDLEAIDTAAALNRDQAAQMIWNTMQAVIIVKTSTIDVTTGEVTSHYSKHEFNRTLLTEKYNGQVETGFITSVPSSKTNPKGIGFQYIDENGTHNVNFRNVTTDVSDLLGYEVKVVWNAGKVNDADAIYGIYATSDNVSYTVFMSDVEQDGAKVKFDGSSYKVATGGMDVYVNGAKVDTDATSAYFAAEPQVPDQITLIDNDGDGSLDAIVRTPAKVVKVSYVGPSSITTTAGTGSTVNDFATSPDLADITVYEGIAKDDYALVTYDVYTDKVVYEKLDVQNATIEGIKGDEVMIGDSWYKAADGYADMPSSLIAGDTIEYVVVNDLLYYVKKTDGSFGSNSLAMIYYMAQGAGVNANTTEAKIITKDGTKKTVTVAKENGNLALYNGANVQVTVNAVANGTVGVDGNAASNWIGRMVTYKVNGDGEYIFRIVSDTNDAGYDDTETMTAATNTAYVAADKTFSGLTNELADNAVVFYLIGATLNNQPGNDAKVYTGKEIKDYYGLNNSNANGKQALTVRADDALISEINNFPYTTAAAVSANAALAGLSGSTFGYLTADAYNRNEGGDDYDYFKLWTSTGAITAKVKGNDYAEYVAGMAISFDVASETDGVYTIKNVSKIANLTTGAITAYDDDKKLAINNVGTVEIDDDTVILYVDSADKTGVESGAITEADGTVANVRVLADANRKIDLLIVDVDNKITSDPATFTAADFEAAQTILNRGQDVVVANYNGNDTLVIPAGQTATVTGTLTKASGAVTGAGTLVVGAIANGTTAGLIQTSNVTVTGSVVAATLGDIPVVVGKTLVLQKDSADNAEANMWYTSVGKNQTSAGNDGEIGASIANSTVIPAGTYVGATVYTAVNGTTGTHWLAQ